MDRIKEVLEKQLELSHEINKALTIIENMKKREIYDIAEEFKNKECDEESYDRITHIKEKVEELLSDNNINKDSDFKEHLLYLKNRLYNMELSLNNMEDDLNKELKEYNKRANLTKQSSISSYDTNKNKSNIEASVNLNIKDEDTVKEVKAVKEAKPVKETNKVVYSNENSINKNNKKIEKQDSYKINDSIEKFEFKIGSNVLNILGVVMILIALVTFGKYIYTNYMTDILKGIFLFVTSSSILIVGECIFRKKVPKFATGVSSLGIGSLYVSIIVNFIVLQTINYIVAIIFTMLVSGISLYISLKNNCRVIRVIGLLGAYICFIPSDVLNVMQSYITVIMLLIISVGNIYFPIEDKKLSIVLSIVNSFVCLMLMLVSPIYEKAIIIYLVGTMILNNIMYVRLSKKEDIDYTLHCMITMMCMIIVPFEGLIGKTIFASMCIVVSVISYYLANDKLKSIFYANGIIALYSLLLANYDLMYRDLYTIVYVALTLLTLCRLIKYFDFYTGVTLAVLIVFGMCEFLVVDGIISILMYISLFSYTIWVMSGNNKENILVIIYKYAFLITLIYNVLFRYTIDSDINYNLIISSIIAIGYVILATNVDRLRDECYKSGNKTILIITFIIINLFGVNNFINAMTFITISGIILAIFMNLKYTDNQAVQKYDLLTYSLYLTYGICVLYFKSELDYEVGNIILSVAIMIIAFINVWIGFKVDKVEVRKYGLVLSLIVCAKLILIDFYSYEFIIKTTLFLIVGVIALIISYIYSKLEQELKNNNQNKEIEQNNK